MKKTVNLAFAILFCTMAFGQNDLSSKQIMKNAKEASELYNLESDHSQAYNLTIKITGVETLKGNILVSIYEETSNFPYGGELKKYTFDVSKHTEEFIIKDLPKGEYSISTFHDENSDGECNTNFLGAPIEGYGFSRNFKPKLSAPSFNDCKIYIYDEKSISIGLIH